MVSPKDFRAIEREYDPEKGNLGRGVKIEPSWLARLIYQANQQGYTLYRAPSGGGYAECLPIFGFEGLQDGGLWFGFVREEAGKHFIVAVEVYC